MIRERIERRIVRTVLCSTDFRETVAQAKYLGRVAEAAWLQAGPFVIPWPLILRS